ncbi:hypothetical protein ACSFB8_10160 [Enterococcus faecalis]
MNLKEKIIEMTEHLYDLTREGKYEVEVDLAALKKIGAKQKSVQVHTARNTSQTIKWRSKNQ